MASLFAGNGYSFRFKFLYQMKFKMKTLHLTRLIGFHISIQTLLLVRSRFGEIHSASMGIEFLWIPLHLLATAHIVQPGRRQPNSFQLWLSHVTCFLNVGLTIRYMSFSFHRYAPFGSKWISLSGCRVNRRFGESMFLQSRKKSVRPFLHTSGKWLWSMWEFQMCKERGTYLGLCRCDWGGVGKAAIYQRVIYVLIKLSDWKVVAHIELGMGKSLKRFGTLRPFLRFKRRSHFSTLVTSGPNSSSHRPVLNWKVGNICRFLQFFLCHLLQARWNYRKKNSRLKQHCTFRTQFSFMTTHFSSRPQNVCTVPVRVGSAWSSGWLVHSLGGEMRV